MPPRSTQEELGRDRVAETAEQTSAPSKESKHKGPRWRRVLSTTLIVLGCIFAPLSIHAVWIHNTLLNTDQYVSTVGPLASNPQVQNALALRASNTLVSGTDLQPRLRRALPSGAQFIVPIIASNLKSFVYSAALKVVQSPKFAQLWENLNRRVHTRVVALLRGQGKFVNNQGQVTIDISGVVDKVNGALQKVGVNGLSTAGHNENIVLFSSSTLASAQSAVRVLDDLAIALPILTALIFAGAIVASTNRRRTILHGAIALAFVMLAFWVIWNALRNPYSGALPPSVNRPAANAVYDQLISFLVLALKTVFALAVVIALAAWLAGPGRIATRVRTTVRNLVAKTPGQSAVRPEVAQFARRYRNPLRLAAVGVGLVILVALHYPSPLSVLVIALVVLVLLGVVEVLARAAEAQPAEKPT